MNIKWKLCALVAALAGVSPLRAAAPCLPSWDSIDSRPVPAWFGDAKFGIFIHWGVYSVPAWSPKGTYSEWYQYWMQTKYVSGNGKFSGTEVYDYHVKTYGKDFTYYQFADEFKADLFRPDDWAGLFARAGAKYVVLTTKHHDGFCLWPSKEADDRGFAWNSMERGPHRDLVGELASAVRRKGLKMGCYYSLLEWFHPWYQNDKPRFVREHFRPQFNDLIQRYHPDLLWGDGDWDLEAETWGTPEIIAKLYNEAPNRDTVVINDRWGKGVMKNHGGYLTTEFASSSGFKRPWEECRGMGFSFGYNRIEDAEDYTEPRALVLMLVDIVAHGGNLLLDIGPDGRGRIPVIMQEHLLQMGQWLSANGEAIYGARAAREPVQWSEGNRDFKPPAQHYVPGSFILKQTVDPDAGYAVKQLFFTRKEENLYPISPLWPGKEIVVKGLHGRPKTTVTLLDTGERLRWKQRGKDFVIQLPEFRPEKHPAEHQYAYAFRISPVDAP
jgi:alpha-L-fucosidase